MTKFGLAALIAATVGSTCVATASKAETFIYAVSVKTNFGTRFNDCFTFDKGTLIVGGLGKLTYTAAPTDPVHFYTAVMGLQQASELGANFAFAGFKTGTPKVGKLHAVGADNHRDAYVVEGNAVASCPATDNASAGSHYMSQAK